MFLAGMSPSWTVMLTMTFHLSTAVLLFPAGPIVCFPPAACSRRASAAKEVRTVVGQREHGISGSASAGQCEDGWLLCWGVVGSAWIGFGRGGLCCC